MTSAARAHLFFIAAAVAGVAHALPSLYWALGGTALVSTLGEWAARWQRESPGEVAVLLSLIFLAKMAGATLPLVNQRGLLPAVAGLHRTLVNERPVKQALRREDVS